jgi:hypothetical protein
VLCCVVKWVCERWDKVFFWIPGRLRQLRSALDVFFLLFLYITCSGLTAFCECLIYSVSALDTYIAPDIISL